MICLGQPVRVFDFYTPAQQAECLAGNQTTNNVATAMQAAIDYAKTLIAPHLIVDSGVHYIGTSSLVFELPDRSTITFEGEVRSANVGTTAITIGHTTQNRESYRVVGLKLLRTTNDPPNSATAATSSTGIRLVNLVYSQVEVLRCLGYTTGLQCAGAGKGFAYNTIFLGRINNNVFNVHLTASDGASGYCNENVFIGGGIGHTGDYAAISTTNIQIDHYATNPLDQNVFIKPSLEDGNRQNADFDPVANNVFAAVINGQNNVLFHPRMEYAGPAVGAPYASSFKIQLTANSVACTVYGESQFLVDSNISDLGVRNNWDTSEGKRLTRAFAAAAAKSVLHLKNTTGSDSKLVQLYDSTGAIVGWANGQGKISMVEYQDASGNKILGALKQGSATYDPPNLADGAGATTTVTVTGAALGEYAVASFSLDLQGITVTAWISAADTVSVRFQNETGGAIDLASGTLRARVLNI